MVSVHKDNANWFGIADYFVFSIVLIASAGIGIFYAIRDRYKKAYTTDAYLMGDRQMSLIPVSLSLMVSFFSGIIIIGGPAEIYTRGITYWWAALGTGLSAAATCWLFVPVFYDLQLTSVYEYLELRFRSAAVRKIGAFLYILVTIVYLSIAIYAPAVALSAVTGLPLWVLNIISGFACTIYVAIGGIKAVVWTDVLQACFMFAGILSVVIQGTALAGGFSHVIDMLFYPLPFSMDFDPFVYMSTPSIVVGQLFSWLGWYGINQSSIQRYCGMKTVRQGQMALLLNIPVVFLSLTLICYIGLAMYAYYEECDPLRAGILAEKDQLTPYFVMEATQHLPGMAGLFLACVYSGTLSTVSSGVNSLAAVVWEDFLKPSCPNFSEQKATATAKCLAFAFGFLATGLSFVAQFLGGLLSATLSTLGAINGPLTGVFLLGVLFPWVNKKGAIVGAIVSFAICTWLCVGAHVTSPYSSYALPTNTSDCAPVLANQSFGLDHAARNNSEWKPAEGGLAKFYSLSTPLYDMLGIMLVLLVALPISFITGLEDTKSMDPRLFNPIIVRLVLKQKKWIKNLTPSSMTPRTMITPDQTPKSVKDHKVGALLVPLLGDDHKDSDIHLDSVLTNDSSNILITKRHSFSPIDG